MFKTEVRAARVTIVLSVIGAILFAPAALISVQAAAKAVASSSSMSVGSGTARVVAGPDDAWTTRTAHTVNSMISSCSYSLSLSARANSGATSLSMNSVTGLGVGMTVSGTGVTAGTYIVSISSLVLTISSATTAAIAKDVFVSFTGCYQAFFSVNNTASIALTNFALSQTVTGTVPGGVLIQKCSGTWTEGTGACSGTISTIISTTSGTSSITNSNISLTEKKAGSTDTVRLRVVANRVGQSTSITTVVQNANHLRAGIITSS